MSRLGNWKLPTSRGNSEEHDDYTGRDGEISVNIDNYTIRLHDGVTQGGLPIPAGDLNFPGGALLVGTLSGNSVQWELDNNSGGGGDPLLRSDLLSNTGADIVGTASGQTVQWELDNISIENPASNVYLYFTSVADMMSASWLVIGDRVGTGGTLWDIASDVGLDPGTFIPLQNNLAATQIVAVHVEDFAIYPENTGTQNSDAWDVMWSLLPNLVIESQYAKDVGTIEFGPGEFSFERPWELKKRATFQGHGNGQESTVSGTKLIFTGADATAITFNAINTLNGGTEVSATGQANGTILRGFHILALNRTAGNSGIWFRTKAKLVDCKVTGFGGWGTRIVATEIGSANTNGSANDWVLDTVLLDGNGTAGVLDSGGMEVAGTHSSRGSAINLSIINSYGRGLREESETGNLYTACTFKDNSRAEGNSASQVTYQSNRYYLRDDTPGIGAATIPGTNSNVWGFRQQGGPEGTYFPTWVNTGTYTLGFCVHSTSQTSRNEFLGCYTGGPQGPALLTLPDKVHGGVMGDGGSGIDPDNTGFIIGAGNRGGVLTGFEIKDPVSTSSITLGTNIGGRQVGMGFYDDEGHTVGITLQNSKGSWGYSYANSAASWGFFSDLTTEQAGRSVVVEPNTPYFKRMVIGSGTGLRHFGGAVWTSNIAFPTTGEYAKGDTYLYGYTVPGQNVGCCCTTSGTAGSTAVFKYFGKIEN